MQPEKRPVTSMAPLIVFDASGNPAVVGGSAGGGQIVDYIASSLVEMLANNRTPAEALARGHVSTAIRGKLQLEKGTTAALHAAALSARGHDVDRTVSAYVSSYCQNKCLRADDKSLLIGGAC